VQRVSQRQGFLVSAAIHLTLLMMLLAQPPTSPRDEIETSELERREIVFLPPPETLRQLVPTPPPSARPRPAPTPTPASPDAEKKDRISVGPPSELRSKGPIILRRDQDLTKVPKGQPNPPAPTPRPATPTPEPRVARSGGEAPQTPRRKGLQLPPGLLGLPVPGSEEGARKRARSLGASVDEKVDELARRRSSNSTRLGIPSGTGKNFGGFHFDEKGADFTLWLNHARIQVYRNWWAPQAAAFYGGHVDFEVIFERDGSISGLRILKSSGTDSLDRAARNALTSSRFMELPNDYGPPRLTAQVTFSYGPPRDS
jgi:protein TonB